MTAETPEWIPPSIGIWPKEIMDQFPQMSEGKIFSKEDQKMLNEIIKKYKEEKVEWLQAGCTIKGFDREVQHIVEAVPLSRFEEFLSCCTHLTGQDLFDEYKDFLKILMNKRDATVDQYKKFVEHVLKDFSQEADVMKDFE